MPKKDKKKRQAFTPEKYEAALAAVKELKVPKDNKEAAMQAGQDLIRQKMNTAAVQAAVKEVTGFSFSFKQITPPKEGEAPASVRKAVAKKVEQEIAEEAMNKLEQALATGKNLEDALGPIAQFYGYENTKTFTIDIFGFWDTWHAHIKKLVAERDSFKWAINELMIKLSPEANKILTNQAVKELAMSTSVLGYLTGNFPPPETMRGYIKVLKEEML